MHISYFIYKNYHLRPEKAAQVYELCIDDFSPNDPHEELLFAAISACTALRHLRLDMESTSLNEIAQYINCVNPNQLTHLSIRCEHLIMDDLAHFREALLRLNRPIKLSLFVFRTPENDFRTLLTCLRGTTVNELCLDHAGFDSDHWDSQIIPSQLLALDNLHTTAIKSLRIATGFTRLHVLALSRLHPTAVERLTLVLTLDTTPDTAATLADFIHTTNSIKALDISYSCDETDVPTHLARIIRAGRTFESLGIRELGANLLGDIEAPLAGLFDAVRTTPAALQSLQTLDLNSTDLTAADRTALHRLLITAPNLHTVDLLHTPLLDDELTEIADALAHMPALSQFGIPGLCPSLSAWELFPHHSRAEITVDTLNMLFNQISESKIETLSLPAKILLHHPLMDTVNTLRRRSPRIHTLHFGDLNLHPRTTMNNAFHQIEALAGSNITTITFDSCERKEFGALLALAREITLQNRVRLLETAIATRALLPLPEHLGEVLSFLYAPRVSEHLAEQTHHRARRLGV